MESARYSFDVLSHDCWNNSSQLSHARLDGEYTSQLSLLRTITRFMGNELFSKWFKLLYNTGCASPTYLAIRNPFYIAICQSPHFQIHVSHKTCNCYESRVLLVVSVAANEKYI